MSAQEIKVPDIGDFSDIPVIEIHVAAGDTVAAEDPLVTLESDKATLDVPAPVAGTVTELRVAVGDTVSEGSVIMVIDAEGGDAAPAASATAPTQQVTETAAAQPAAAATAAPMPAANIERGDQHAEVRRARRRARRLHRSVPRCRPRQAGRADRKPRPARRRVPERRLHPVQGAAARGQGHRREPKEMSGNGLTFAKPKIDIDAHPRLERKRGRPAHRRARPGWRNSARCRWWRHRQVHLAQQRRGQTAETGRQDGHLRQRHHRRRFQLARSPFFPYDDPRMIDSTGALALKDVPKRMLVIGGGIIGLEMATVYDAAGQQDQRGRIDGPADARRRQGPGQAAAQPHRQALRSHHAEDQGHQDRGRTKTGLKVTFEGEQAPPSRRCTTRC